MLQELIRKGYIGNPLQLCTLRHVTVSEGKAKGTRIIEVRTAGGLELDVLPDAGGTAVGVAGEQRGAILDDGHTTLVL